MDSKLIWTGVPQFTAPSISVGNETFFFPLGERVFLQSDDNKEKNKNENKIIEVIIYVVRMNTDNSDSDNWSCNVFVK